MKIVTKSLIVFFIIILSTSAIYSQYLVELSQKQTDTPSLFWYYEIQNSYFAAIEKFTELDKKNIEYKILDDDIETGKFYWIESKSGSKLDLIQLSIDNNVKMLWDKNSIALLKIKNIKQFLDNSNKNFEIKRLDFHNRSHQSNNSFIPRTNFSTAYKKSIIDAIIDSVSIDEIIYTEEHLSGEAPFLLNGYLDSIQTRYSYSPQIHKAKNYLQDRFENYGYSVDYLPFAMGTFYDIQFVPSNPDYGWLTTTDKIFGTSDRGNSWSVQYEGTNGGDLWSVFAYNQNLAVAVGEFGNVIRTTDGQNWQLMNTPTSAFLFGVHFKSDTLGWICGDTGLILKTIDGGSTWITKTTPISDRLYDITFINDSTGWAVGRSGRIIHTNNYGESWTSQTTPITDRLYGVYFKDENEGFAVGWYGSVLHTTNGGTNWTSLSVPLNENFYDIDFIDQNIGMIIGWDGACLVTSTGGASWTSAGNIFQQDMYAFDLIDASEAWVSGVSTVAQSTDFGSNWTNKLDSIPSGALINLIATKTGTTYPDQHYIVCAHYDATSNDPMNFAPGADDNGSGTSAVIEAARILRDYDFKYSIKFVLFPGEEQGLHGSAAYAANASATGEQIQGVLNMDMIAYDGNGDDLVEIHAGTLASSQAIGSFMISNVNTFGLTLTTQYLTSNSSTASDHSSFWDFGFPAIMHIEDFQDFTPYYHTTNDLLSNLTLGYFHENARLTIGTLALLAEIDSIANTISENRNFPINFKLEEPYPNPFNPTVNIEYSLTKADNISLEIFDILGKNIKTILYKNQAAGNYKLAWDGKNSSNHNVASGIYLLKFKTTNKNIVKKLILMR
jgi:photosystem II stability/assembly factor-like uncharacterized protein